MKKNEKWKNSRIVNEQLKSRMVDLLRTVVF